jgi:signal recognition particle subunit SRP19
MLTNDAERMLYKAISTQLKKHPTTAQDPFSLPVRGLSLPEGDMPPPAVPRGWRINDILPLHSAAVTGGGVSDNIMKDIQAAMAGQNPALAAMTGEPASQGKIEPAKKKKDKGKKK